MKKSILALLILTGLSGCGFLKNVTTSHHSQSSNSKTDSVFHNTVNDHSLITTTEKLDTVVYTKPVSIEVNKPADVDTSGSFLATLDTLMMKVNVKYDKLSKTIHFNIEKKAEPITVQINKTTTEQRNIQSKSKGEVKKHDKKSDDQKDKYKAPNFKVIGEVIGLVFLFFTAIFLFLKYKIKTVNPM